MIMSKVILINGSPRKGWNTDLLLKEAQKGAESVGAETEYVNLYDLNYTGCKSCFGCKIKGGKNNGHCIINDDLKPVLQTIDKADALILGSPIYWSEMTGKARTFYERFMYQVTNYEGAAFIDRNRRLKVACIYTMNAPDGYMDELFQRYEQLYNLFYDYVGTVEATETLQVSDYSRFYVGEESTETYRKQRREKVFSEVMKQAYDLGIKICS